MSALRPSITVVLTLCLLLPAFGQSGANAPDRVAADRPQRITPSRILAGVRGYSDQVIDALVRLAPHPQVLERAADDLRPGRQPTSDTSDLPPDLTEAIELLARTPEALMLAAMHPQEVQQLRSLRSVAPDGFALRLAQLRRGYEQADREATWAWQRALENDSVALGEYRDLLTRFCQAQREVYPDFACVHVTDRRYYYACRPTEALVFYASEVDLPPSLFRVLAVWWSEHAPQRVDERLISARGVVPAVVNVGGFVYDWPASRRAPMWQPTEVGEGTQALGLVPVVMQPPADQPPAARLALAVAEHVRLWSPPLPILTLCGPDVADRPKADTEPPAIVIEEPIPGPQTAQRDDIVEYGDFPNGALPEYELLRPAGLYYGYSASARYYRDPLYTTYYWPGSVYCPSNVYYVGRPYRTGGGRLHVSYHARSLRVDGSRRHERTHYGGRRHHANIPISVGSHRRQHVPRVQVSTPSRRQAVRSHHPRPAQRVVRNRGVVPGRSIRGTGRSGSGTRAVRSGTRPAIRSGTRPAIRPMVRGTVRSQVRSAIRSRLHQAVRSRVQSIRSGSRANRSGTRAVSSSPQRGSRASRGGRR